MSKDMTLDQIVSLIRAKSWIIAIAAVVGVVSGSLFVIFSPHRYEATITLAPDNFFDTDRSTASGVLESILPINAFPANEITGFEEILITMESTKLASDLFKDSNLIKKLMEYDEASNTYASERSIVRRLKKAFDGLFGVKRYLEPDAFELNKLLKKKLVFETERESAKVVIRFRHKDRDLAAEVLRRVVFHSSEIVRAEKRTRYTSYVAFLRGRFAEETLEANRALLSGLLSRYENELVLVQTPGLYGGVVLDPVYVDNEPVAPDPILALAVGTALVPFLTIVYFLTVAAWRSSR